MINRFLGSLVTAILVLAGLSVSSSALAATPPDAGAASYIDRYVSIAESSALSSAESLFGPVGKPILNKKRQLVGEGIAPGSSASRSALSTWYYQYAVATFDDTATGLAWDMNVESPWKSSADYHTLEQAAVCKDGTAMDCIELGWIKTNSSTVCSAGSSVPCLFVGRRTGGVFGGYNSADASYVDEAANTTINAGISLNGAVGGQRHFRIVHNTSTNPDQWEVWYGTGANGSTWKQRVGYWPDTVWSGNFTSAGFTELYGEITSDQREQADQCTDMGKNVTATTTAGFKLNNIDLLGVTGEVMDTNFVSPSGLVGRGSAKISNSEFNNGGPGSC